MTDDEWEQRRNRAILTALQTGRPVFANSEGELRFVDGDRETLDADGDPAPAKPSWWARLRRWIGG